MKTFFSTFFLGAFVLGFGQSVTDYSVVHVPKVFSDFKTENKYGLNTLLISKLKQKNYTVLETETDQWSAEYSSNPCSVLVANVVDDSSFLKNKVILELTDCNGRKVSSFEAKTNIKEFEAGYKDALNKALAEVPVSSGNTPESVVDDAVAQVVALANNAPVKTVVKEKKPKSEVPNVKNSSSAEQYSNGNLILNRVNLAPGNFILTNSSSSVAFATFKESGKKDVFHVQLENGSFGIAYFENGDMVIEVPQNKGVPTVIRFNKK